MHAHISVQELAARVAALEAEVESLEKEVESLKKESGEHEDAEAIVKSYIKLRPRYNEIKDAIQILTGKLATLKEMTVRQMLDDLD
ncbi:hypothetical protein B0H16DRAFT_1721330 [Mycena metata]|uniref:Uncharacterized protein n=1 Tax=Mycena metata TaxID=1033252 RepID=A0AAD7J6V4_9AGAR|nr:hypothetical protein B0H16DRAFT_1721330 [Mycena metata]